MNKQRILIFGILLLLLAASIFIFRNKIFKTNHLSDFAVKDTAAITRIFLADKNGNQSILDKNSEGKWRVNGKYDVQKSKLQTLMDAIYRVRIKSPVPKKERDDVIKILATSIKVMIYKGDELQVVYYVGSETRDHLGTYMCIENADDPMITEIPGFNGFLTPRYLTREEDWKSNAIVSLTPDKIKLISVDYDGHPEISFTLKKNQDMFVVNCNKPEIKEVYSNQQKIGEYLALFSNLSIEGFDNSATNAFNDSLQRTQPFATLRLIETDDSETIIKMYYKILPEGREQRDDRGQPTIYDQNRYYAISNKDKRVMVVQIGNFGHVLQRFDFFR